MKARARVIGSLLIGAAAFGAPALRGQATPSPHGALPRALTCTSCHTTEGWSPLRVEMAFDHARDAGFRLDGRHSATSCASCHRDLDFASVSADPGDCASCHRDVHLGTASRPCASCHTTESFSRAPAGVVHPADFPLAGAHLQTTCESCHVDDLGGAFAPIDRECASCHLAEYATAPLVDHQRLGFSTDCTECHTLLDFRDVLFDHTEISGGFELVGAHAGVECTTCHNGPGGAVTSAASDARDCVACHLAEYEGEHGGSGFPTDCLACHSAFDWDDAEFDHALTTGFELIPDHDRLLCMECHVGSTAQTLYDPSAPEDCYACHVDDYQAEHTGTGFTVDCRECHRSTTWAGATFDHSFPITSGPHSNRNCASCHTTPGTYDDFSCLSCHEHRQAVMDDKHSSQDGYVYESRACLSCHPDGTH